MLKEFDKERATIFAHCCGAATHFNRKLPYYYHNPGIYFSMEEIKPLDPSVEEAFEVHTSQGVLYFAGLTSINIKGDTSIKEVTFSGNYMGDGKESCHNNGEGVFPPDTVKHGQFSALLANKSFDDFLNHKGVIIWVNPVKGKTSAVHKDRSKTLYDMLEKYPEFKEEFDKSIIYRSKPYSNWREAQDACLELIITDRG